MNKKTGLLGLLILVLIVVVLFGYNSNSLTEKHQIEQAIKNKIENDNTTSQKAFGALLKKKIELQSIKVWGCETEDNNMTCHADVDEKTFRGEENQEMKVKLEKNSGSWKAVSLSKV